MKVNIGIENRDNYLNINPLEGKDITNLDRFVDDGECHEIIVTQINMLPYNRFQEIVYHWIRKLRHGGTIVLQGIDFDQVIKNYGMRKINIMDINKIVYGDLDNAWASNQACLTMAELVAVAESAGLIITKKRIDNNQMMLEANRA